MSRDLCNSNAGVCKLDLGSIGASKLDLVNAGVCKLDLVNAEVSKPEPKLDVGMLVTKRRVSLARRIPSFTALFAAIESA